MQWQAKWIWARPHLGTPNFYMYARRAFEVDSAPRAHLSVTCFSDYKLYINGRFIGRGPGVCGGDRRIYDEYDISHAIRRGKNVIGAICYNYGVDTQFQPAASGGFLLQLEMANGIEPAFIVTDKSWKVLPARDWAFDAPRIAPDLGFQEIYDSRAKPVAWNVVGFDDSRWDEPWVCEIDDLPDAGRLVPRRIPNLRYVDVLPQSVRGSGACDGGIGSSSPVKYAGGLVGLVRDVAVVNPGSTAFCTLDFGSEVVGYPIIRIVDGGVGAIEIAYSESVDERGRIDLSRAQIRQMDRLVLHGGRQDWQGFSRRVFRYMQMTFHDLTSPVRIEGIAATQAGYPADEPSAFECSDDLLNSIWRNGIRTLGLCMQDEFEPWPLGRRAADPSDSRLQALVNYCSFFDAALPAEALRRFAESSLRTTRSSSVVSQSELAWLVMLHEHYLHVGDKSLVQEFQQDAACLLERHLTGDEHPSTLALWYQALRGGAKLASAIGDTDGAVSCHDRAEALLGEFNERFWSSDAGAYIDAQGQSLEATVIALASGIADAERSERARDVLSAQLSVGAKPLTRPLTDLRFGYQVLQALVRLDLDRETLDYIRAMWGGMAQRGATTCWESFDPAWPEHCACDGGLCCGASTAPVHYFVSQILGVRPTLPESDVSIVQPRPGGLEWAKGQVKTHGGVVVVEWQAKPGSFSMDLYAPGGFVVGLPVGDFVNPQIREIDLSPETPERRARRTYGWKDIIWLDGEEHDPYLDWLATQEEQPEDYESRSRCHREHNYVWIRESTTTNVRYEVTESVAIK